MGPLAGIKVVELAGIGPGPFARCSSPIWAPRSLRVDRAANVGHDDSRVGGPAGEEYRFNLLARGRRKHRGRSEGTRTGSMPFCALSTEADALIEGFRPGVMERWLGPDICLPRTRSSLWAHDRLGPGWAHRPYRRTRHQHIALSGVLADDRRGWRTAGPALKFGRRLRRRPRFTWRWGCWRDHQRQASAKGQVIDTIDGRRLGLADDDDVCRAASAAGSKSAPQPHRRRLAFLPCLRNQGRRACCGRFDRAAILQAAADPYWLEGAGLPPQTDRSTWPAMKEKFRRDLQAEDAGRVGRDHAGHRHLLRAGAEDVGSAAAPAQPAPRQFSGDRRHSQPAPAPRFLGTPTKVQRPPAKSRREHRRNPARLGLSPAEIAALHQSGAVNRLPADPVKSGALHSPCGLARRGSTLRAPVTARATHSGGNPH